MQKQVTLNPGDPQVVSFEVKPTVAKTYHVSVDGLTGSFEAISAMPPAYHYIHLIGGEAPEGWNEIVYDGKSGDIVSLTANIVNLSIVYYWDATVQEWLAYWPEFGINTIGILQYGEAYQIHTRTTQDWKVPNF